MAMRNRRSGKGTFPSARGGKGGPALGPRDPYQLYETLKSALISKVTDPREYELAMREAARRAGV